MLVRIQVIQRQSEGCEGGILRANSAASCARTRGSAKKRQPALSMLS